MRYEKYIFTASSQTVYLIQLYRHFTVTVALRLSRSIRVILVGYRKGSFPEVARF